MRALLMFLLVLVGAPLIAPGAAGQQQVVIRVYSATDSNAFRSIIADFEARNPGISIEYTEFNTLELYEELSAHRNVETLGVDIIISSATDLQIKLVNAGMAQAFFPERYFEDAQWRHELYGFTFEPVVVAYNKEAFAQRPLPLTRSELASMMRDDPAFFDRRVGTYDIRLSGVGYLFASQDAERGYQFSRIAESFGRAEAKTYCCTSLVIDAVDRGELVFGYNLIGSYALSALKDHDNLGIYLLDDYTLVMSRSAFVPKASRHKIEAERFVSYLLSPQGQRQLALHSGLIPLDPGARELVPGLGDLFRGQRTLIPIRFGPGLMAHLDHLKQDMFWKDWETAMDVSPEMERFGVP